MYVTSREGNKKAYIIEYSLSKPFDISTATISFTGGSPKGTALTCDAEGVDQMQLPHAIEFKPDGTRMFITSNKNFGKGNTDVAVYQFKLTTPFDLRSGVTPGEISGSLATSDTSMRNIQFNSDGTALYVAGDTNARMNKYTLSTAYDITTLSSTFSTFDLGSRAVSYTHLTLPTT